MKAYYEELIKFVPHPIEIMKREELRSLWKLEPYPCVDIFEDFYECFQNARDIRMSSFEILPIEEICIKNGGLVFAIGHKTLYPIGVEISDLDYEEPRVKYQTHENGRWYNESGSLRSFLFNISAWQILHTMNSTAHIKEPLKKAHIKRHEGKGRRSRPEFSQFLRPNAGFCPVFLRLSHKKGAKAPVMLPAVFARPSPGSRGLRRQT